MLFSTSILIIRTSYDSSEKGFRWKKHLKYLLWRYLAARSLRPSRSNEVRFINIDTFPPSPVPPPTSLVPRSQSSLCSHELKREKGKKRSIGCLPFPYTLPPLPPPPASRIQSSRCCFTKTRNLSEQANKHLIDLAKEKDVLFFPKPPGLIKTKKIGNVTICVYIRLFHSSRKSYQKTRRSLRSAISIINSFF